MTNPIPYLQTLAAHLKNLDSESGEAKLLLETIERLKTYAHEIRSIELICDAFEKEKTNSKNMIHWIRESCRRVRL